MVKIVLIFLLVMIAIAVLAGPGFRRFLLKFLGISRRDR